MSFKHTLLFLLSIVFIGLAKTNAQNTKKPINIEHLMQIKNVNNPVISPDGKWVAYTLSQYNIEEDKSETRIWMIPTSGGEAIPMTGKGYSASSPKWSYDNKFLSFLASKKGEKTQVWVLNRQGGEAEKITEIPQGVSGYEWSPDKETLLLLLKDPKPEDLTKDKEDDKKKKPIVVDRLQFKRDYVGYLDRYRTHLYILKPGDSLPKQLTFGDFEDKNPAWSPDGKNIAFVSNRTENPDANDNDDIWIVSTTSKDEKPTLKRITSNENRDDSPQWSPDGRQITYTTILDKKAIWYATQFLAVKDIAKDDPIILTKQLDRNISKPKFSADGKKIFFLLEEQGSSSVSSINLRTNKIERVVKGEISVADFSVHEETIISLLGKSNEPRELYKYYDKTLEALTKVNTRLLNEVKKPEIEKISFKSKDGTLIEGFLVKPTDYSENQTYPTILWNHGGPVSQYEYRFHATAQLFAANGYAVLLINPRGSSGYGQEFSEVLFADWGNKDFQDVLSAVDYAIDQGIADPDKLGVGGWSYGGILTNYVITQSNRFKGAISGASEALYRSNYGHDHYQLYWELELGLPWENAEAWEQISPFNKVANIITPTLWMGGSDDWNVPILNSEQMYQAMKRLGIETQLVVYPDEHHGIKRPSFIKDRYQRFLSWFNHYVKQSEE
ncbi:S9 family peptidase [Eudoraea chungangensis]|uniref:S9 family peptidase n=1 Tax=Eudoraea chungangensis TaxID=1481905 RepID=UPI0023EDF11F|nr:S9 family peptidase [Eudoraea chungangensis]